MKTTAKIIALVLATGLVTGCAMRNENSAQIGTESERDSVERVAPASDGMPTDGSSPSNAGSPPDSAAMATDSTSIR